MAPETCIKTAAAGDNAAEELRPEQRYVLHH